MKNIFRFLLTALLVVSAVIPGKADVYKYEQTGGKGHRAQTAAGCSPSSSFEWLDINNVRTRINAGGDMWWDLPGGTGSKYYIPANGSATSLYAGSLWIAGVDINGQLKCAALRFRQVGNDYYTGPLTTDGRATIDDVTCASWDRIFKINRAQVDEFLANCDENGIPDPSYNIPTIIKNWPAHPGENDPAGISHYLAPFYDRDGDGEYDPTQGDYPYYDIDNELCHTKIPTKDEEIEGSIHGSILADQVLKGDQTLWWIFNDKGASHTESGGDAIGIEVRAQAFAFATNDEINNMTFYSYEIINRSTYTLTGTYFSPWTDVDLGYGYDDYVGCDVARGLGYGYNGKSVDGSGEPEAYGSQPPALGIDFFQGPYMDPDGIDNPKYTYTVSANFVQIDPVSGDSIFTYDTTNYNQIADESINGVNFGNGIIDDERFGMRRFVYHNNSSDDNGDPTTAPQYYNYLRGIWKNGAKMRYGGNALSGNDVVGPECDFMFPGDSDPWNWGTGGFWPNAGYNQNGKIWTEETCGNAPNDRRFMQSAGPFTLQPGAVNYITFGVPWARATSGGPWASVELLRVVDDKCQALFDNCFKVIDGPNAPDLTIRELDQQLIIYLSNAALSNNYKEGYVELDPEIPEWRADNIRTEDSIPVPCQIDGIDTVLYQLKYHDSTIITYYDRYYHFEGYKVYQLASAEVGADELSDNSKARLVFQSDIKNNVSRLINYEYDESLQASVPRLKVDGANAGITHSFVITEDKFATGDNPTLVNHKTYYFMAVSYAYNNYSPYNTDEASGLYGQKKPYLEGRKNIQVYSAVPHKIVDGTILNSKYGDQPSITRIVGQGNGGLELELTKETVERILSKPMADDSVNVMGSPNYPIDYHPTYEAGYGPIGVKIIDPLNVVTTDYELWFDTLFQHVSYNVTGDNEIRGDSATRMASHWYLRDKNTGEVFSSDTITVYGDEKMFIDRGISITINQPYDIGRLVVGEAFYSEEWHPTEAILATNNGVITSSIEFDDPTNQWLDGIRDKDVPGTVLNWIRSGTYYDRLNPSYNDYSMTSDAYGSAGKSKPWDPNEDFEKIAYGTWAPYLLTAVTSDNFPAPNYNANSRATEFFKNTSSVDIVFTSDTNLWTRCPVIDVCGDRNLSEGFVRPFSLRMHASVDKKGRSRAGDDFVDREGSLTESDPDFIAAQGMGWFPGYVIDVESGARLNVVFTEDSYLEDMNGRDMIFNPAKLRKSTVDQELGDASQLYDPAVVRNYGTDNEPVMGGKHYVYIFRMDSIPMASTSPWKDMKNYAYDGGRALYNTLKAIQNTSNVQIGSNLRINFFKLAMWVGMPMGVEGTEWLPEGNDCRIRIRLAKPYDMGYANIPLKQQPESLMVNNLYPKYEFSIQGMNPTMNDPVKSEEDLDLVTVVPNPYYAYSNYEGNALTNRVKIANLPKRCVVTIFTINGTKVRQFKKDNDDPNINWDLTNYANTPVASGFYLIHVKDLTSGGERTIKFFGAMRKIDLNTF